MNQKAAELATKFAFGALVSAFIGYTIKAERRVDERIEEHFDRKKSTKPPQ